MVKLLKNIKCNDKVTWKMLETIHDRYQTCKKYKTTPPRPVVSLPTANEFNKELMVELKDAMVQKYRYILYMINGFTRQTVGVFIRDKKTTTIVNSIMHHWVSVYGRPARL